MITVPVTTLHVTLTQPTYDMKGMSAVVAAYIGKQPRRQLLHSWFHHARERGYFPNSRKERPDIQNSVWVIPASDLEKFTRETWPLGVLPHLSTEDVIF